MPMSQLMKECLINPKYGYYTTKELRSSSSPSASSDISSFLNGNATTAATNNNSDTATASSSANAQTTAASATMTSSKIFGSGGDFITSPEISSMFGESLTVYLVSKWHELGSPRDVKLVEMGPGRGTLMSDILTHSKASFRDFYSSIESVNLVELSPSLRVEQRNKIAPLLGGVADASTNTASTSSRLRHFDTLADFMPLNVERKNGLIVEPPPPPANDRNNLFILSHEFYDCLAVNVYERVKGVWHEKYLDYDVERDEFRFVLLKLDVNIKQTLLDSKAFHLPNISQYAQSIPIGARQSPKLRQPLHAAVGNKSPSPAPSSSSASLADQLAQHLSDMSTTAAVTSSSSSSTLLKSGTSNSRTSSSIQIQTDLSATDYLEVSFDAMSIFEHASHLIAARGGLQLLIDYGNVRVDYPSLRFIANHKIAENVDSDYLKQNLGNVDLSVDVHFAPLMALANKYHLAPLLSSQGAFLRRCAIEPLLVRKLTKAQTAADVNRIIGEFRRLVDDDQMGRIYKVLETQKKF